MSISINYSGERSISSELPKVAKYSNFCFSCEHNHQRHTDEVTTRNRLKELVASTITCIQTYEVACTAVRNDFDAELISKSDRDGLLRLINSEIEQDKKLVEIANLRLYGRYLMQANTKHVPFRIGSYTC